MDTKTVSDSLVNFESSTLFLEDSVTLSTLDLRKLRQRPTFNLVRFADAHYLGDIANGLRHGLGVMVYKSGRRYEGSWLQDKRSGSGLEVFANGHSYSGGYNNGKHHGQGLYRWSPDESYAGDFVNGLRQG